MRKIVIFTTLAILLLTACQKTPTPLPSHLLWDKDWQGSYEKDSLKQLMFKDFIFKKDCLVNHTPQPQMLLWSKRSGMKEVKITYQLNGRPATVFMNWNMAGAGMLEPSQKFIEKTFSLDFKPGANYIVLGNDPKAELKIKKLTVEKDVPFENSLQEGESVTFFCMNEKVDLTLSGRGRTEIQQQSWVEGRDHRQRQEIKLSLFNPNHDFHAAPQTPMVVTIKNLEGTARIASFSTSELEPRKKNTPGIKLVEPKNVFIVLIDACQARHLGCYGYSRPTSPNIDELSRDAVLFENAFANASFTRSSVASIFSGLYPENHGVRIMNDGLSKKLLILPEFLSGKGFRTAIFSAAATISKNFGFHQGVDHYQAAFGQWKEFDKRKKFPRMVLDWIKPQEKNFVYLHFLEPHLPIVPLPPYLDMFGKPKDEKNRVIDRIIERIGSGHEFTEDEISEIVNDYDSTIAYVDNEVGTLLKGLKEKGVYDDSLIIFISDHGEALYEHKVFSHGSNVYPETMHVPLLIKFPASMGLQGTRIKRFVQLHSIYPTIADLFGTRFTMDGASLLETLENPDIGDDFTVGRSFTEAAIYNIAFRKWFLLYHMNSNQRELYYHQGLKDLKKENPEMVKLLESYLFRWVDRIQKNSLGGSLKIQLNELPEEQLENLRSLGYID